MSDLTTEAEIRARYVQARRNLLQAKPKFRDPPPPAPVKPSRAAFPLLRPGIERRLPPHEMYIWARPSPMCGPFYPGRHPIMGVAFADPSGLRPRIVVIDRIIKLVCERYRIRRVDLLSTVKWPHVRWPRHTAIYLVKKFTRRSTPDIGRRFGGRDHTTIMHAVRCVEKRLVDDRAFAEEVGELEREVMGHT